MDREKMQIIIFGTGKLYQKTKPDIKNDFDIIAFIDNDPSKWGSVIDGITVFSPEQMPDLTYDAVFILSIHYLEMRCQLRKMGVPDKKIYDINDRGKFCGYRMAQFFGEIKENEKGKNILVFSHALTSTGAQNVLYTALQVLIKNRYYPVVVSKYDGILKKDLLSLGVPVIIVEDIAAENEEITGLVHWADKIFVNTLWLYYVVEELQAFDKKVVWWIHESGAIFYLDDSLLSDITCKNMVDIYAVSPLVRRTLIQRYGVLYTIHELQYGLPEYGSEMQKLYKKNHSGKIVFAVIGGIAAIKGQDIFIRAASSLPIEYHDRAEFWIIGCGSLGEKEAEIAQKYPSIQVKGEIEHNRMGEIYSQIDVVVCCSREDALPVVVAEACMNGKLSIISDRTGIAEYITDGYDGLIFESENIIQLARKMQWVMDHTSDAGRMGRNSRKVYEACFSMERFEDALLKIIEKE